MTFLIKLIEIRKQKVLIFPSYMAIKSLENAHFEMVSNSGIEKLTFTFNIIFVLEDLNFWLPTTWNLR